jgi:hypothetical protein
MAALSSRDRKAKFRKRREARYWVRVSELIAQFAALAQSAVRS